MCIISIDENINIIILTVYGIMCIFITYVNVYFKLLLNIVLQITNFMELAISHSFNL